MAGNDSFIDADKIQKMIALGIYDEDMANKMKDIKNKDFETMVRPADKRTPVKRMEKQPTSHPNPAINAALFRGRGRGPQRGRGFMDRGRGGRNAAPLTSKFGYNSAYNWKEVIDDDFDEQIGSTNKRPRSPSMGDPFHDTIRDGIRDGIQNKIQRNEIERKLNSDFIDDRNAVNSSNDTDLRPKSDTDSRIRDTDLRTATNPLNNRKTTTNSTPITSTSKDGDYRQFAGGDGRGSQRGGHSLSSRDIERNFFASKSGERSGPSIAKNPFVDDIDDFIANANKIFNIKPSEVPELVANRPEWRNRGRPQERHNNSNRNYGNEGFINNDPLGLNQSDEEFNRRHSTVIEEDIDSRPPVREEDIDRRPPVREVAVEDEDQNPIAILKETVEELAKSNLYCQYCDCYLGSLAEVNTHIGTPIHQKNMTKKVMEETNSSGNSQLISRTIVERLPTGMAAIVQLIEQKKQITLKTLTEMDNYEINCDSEAALAKELAKLLTNELLNYKMSLMPDTVKEALKHQGINLLNSMVAN